MASSPKLALERGSSLRWLREGMTGVAPAAPGIVLFGAGFGAAASAQGIDASMAVAMSALVFAGAAQLGAIEMWSTPGAAWLILLTVLGINARHILLGATLAGRLKNLPRWQCLMALALISDVNWAATMASPHRHRAALLHMAGGGMALWLAWVGGTFLGGFAGVSLGAVDRLGIDALMPAFFACLLVEQMRATALGRRRGRECE